MKYTETQQKLKDIFNSFNVFGNMGEIAKKHLTNNREMTCKLFALTGIYLVYQYKVIDEMDAWDKRSEASKKYFFNNYQKTIDLFEKYAGFRPDIIFEKGTLSKSLGEYTEWITSISTEHPTIIQSFVRGMTSVMASMGEDVPVPEYGLPMI